MVDRHDVVTGGDPRAGQETARLVSAAQDWLRTSAPHLAPVGPDGVPCSCPLCRVVTGLREADPDTVGRWVDSAVAAFGAVATQAADLAPSRDPSGKARRDSAEEAGLRATGQTPIPDDENEIDDVAHLADVADVEELGDGDAVAGQDEPRPRGVRRIPLGGDDGRSAR